MTLSKELKDREYNKFKEVDEKTTVRISSNDDDIVNSIFEYDNSGNVIFVHNYVSGDDGIDVYFYSDELIYNSSGQCFNIKKTKVEGL